MTLKEAVGKVLKGWTLPNSVRKILEEAYFAEPQRTWVGLTDEEMSFIKETTHPENRWMLMERVEAKLKEKNT